MEQPPETLGHFLMGVQLEAKRDYGLDAAMRICKLN